MRKRRWVVMVGVCVLTATFLGSAVASVPPTVAKTNDAAGPRLVVDSKGTVSLAWTAANSHGQTMIQYARRPKGSKRFTKVTLPRIADTNDPFIYEASPGVLQIIATQESGSFPQVAWRSTNEGKSWTIVNTDALNTAMKSAGLFPLSEGLTETSGGPAEYASDDFDPTGVAIQYNASLTKATTIATNTQGLNFPQVGRTAAGVTYLMDTPSNTFTTDEFKVGSHTGQLSFPTCTNTASRPQLAVGHSGAVAAFSGCGHTYARTISTAGKVGPLVKVGPAFNGVGASGGPWLDLVADRSGHYTMAFTVSGGDLQIAHSANGSHWATTAARLVPTATGLNYQSNGAVSIGAATWYAETVSIPLTTNDDIEATALAATYRVPKPPSAHGIAHPRRGRLGSLAAVVPGSLSARKLEHSGRVKVRVVDSLSTTISVSVTFESVSGETVTDGCNTGASVRLKGGHAKLVTELCPFTGFVMRGGSRAVPAKAKVSVSFGFSSRNGTLTLVSPAH
jgi:hypothetical protein